MHPDYWVEPEYRCVFYSTRPKHSPLSLISDFVAGAVHLETVANTLNESPHSEGKEFLLPDEDHSLKDASKSSLPCCTHWLYSAAPL